ncbi:MAG TPA: hypothetical protein VHG32_00700 [Thermoanaerobaculia bacterium]|jgi:hypothetical protein|nr:hypothetical protein [Thermoanaerobaculia bacterium]
MSEDSAARLVAGGAALARQANRPRIEQEVRARYAAELAAADICDSLRLETQIRAEIERALDQAAPPDALY